MLNFDFLEKGLGVVSPPHFMYDFSRKMFFMLYSINWPNFIVCLHLLPNDTHVEQPQKRLATRTFKNWILAASVYIIAYTIN